MTDIAIIGGGPAGYTGAIRARELGLSVTLIERDAFLGGTCLNRGCIPTKSLLKSAELFAEVRKSALFGLDATATLDDQKVYARKDEVIAKLRAGIAFLMKKHGVTVITGNATFIDAHTLAVTTPTGTKETVEAAHIIIATGSKPARIPIPGIEHALNSDDVLAGSLAATRVAIIGGGVIGTEFATFLAASGKQVTMIEALPRILATLDPDVASYLGLALKKAGVAIHAGAKVLEIVKRGDADFEVRAEIKGKVEAIAAEAVIVSVGRGADFATLALENAGVRVDRRILVDETLRTNVSHIYAVGDVASRIQLAHVAEAEAVCAVERIAGIPPSMDLNVVPSCVYTSPEVASVGTTTGFENPASVVSGKAMMGASGKALIEDQTTGFVKLVFDRATRCLLGGVMVCPRATDMIAEIALALHAGLTVDDITATIHPHPTVSESVREAAHAARSVFDR